MTDEVQDFGPKGCPFLGLDEDRSVMLMDSSPLHRCYAVPGDNHTPTIQFQTETCLSAAHGQCPRYSRAQPSVQFVRPAPRKLKTRQARTPMIVAALMTLLTVGVLGWLALAFLRPSTQEAAVTTPPAGEESVVQSGAETPDLATGEAVEPEAAEATSAPTGGEDAPTTVQTPVLNADSAATPTPILAATGGQETPSVPAANQGTAEDGEAISIFNIVTPTPVAGSEVKQLRPSVGNAGWWTDGDPTQANLNDSFLYAGKLNGQSYVSAMRFDLSRIPRGASLDSGGLTLIGLRAEQLDPAADVTWLVQLIAESELSVLAGADFMMLYSAPASITLAQLTPADLAVQRENRWQFDVNTLRWLEEQRLAGVESLVVRITSDGAADATALFGWDSGLGAVSSGNPPLLTLQVGPEPTATPPLPTRDFVVATFTPAPANVLTVEAQQQTATAVAAAIGTYTPMPYFVTPTPQPQNLATVQAGAVLANLPAVVLETPTPANAEVATEYARYATAVAVTTGTFTPVPTAYVTPFLVFPSPPAENLQTAVARNVEATAVVQTGAATSTPLPYNAVIAEYVIATVTPVNVATAAAIVQEATAAAELMGTATATPWEWIVITPTPLPLTPLPTVTPTLPPLILERDFTPTPTPLPVPTEVIPDSLPAEFRNKVLFRTNRNGADETYLLDPGSGDTGKITRDWVYPMAAAQLAVSPDGSKIAIVKQDIARILQIYVRSLEYGTDTQITFFATDSYDPAWSPNGDWIAFVGTNSGNDEVYRVSPDGQTVQQLTTNTYEWDKHPTWSPDGSQILFYSNRDTGRRQLWVMNADGGGQRNFSSNGFEDWDPVWTR